MVKVRDADADRDDPVHEQVDSVVSGSAAYARPGSPVLQ
jgi:hypothetical protein